MSDIRSATELSLLVARRAILDLRQITLEIESQGGALAWATRWGLGVSFEQCRLWDQDLWELQRMLPLVAWLDLSDTQLTDAALPALQSARRLETLELNGTGISVWGLQKLRNLPRLVEIRAGDTGVSSREIAELRANGWPISIENHRRGAFCGWLPGFTVRQQDRLP